MTIIDASIMINGSATRVWEILSDLALLPKYDPTVQTSKVVTAEAEGVGATRELVLTNGDRLRESITTFEPRKRLELHTYATSMAVKNLDRSYALDDEGSRTRVTLVVEYEAKYGHLGKLIEKAWLGRRLADVTHAGLYALKRYVEISKK